MTCECGHEHKPKEPGDLPDSHGIPGVTAPAGITHYHNYVKCECGCLELRERVAVLEQAVYQLSLIVENREKAAGEPQQPKRRFIGDKGA